MPEQTKERTQTLEEVVGRVDEMAKDLHLAIQAVHGSEGDPEVLEVLRKRVWRAAYALWAIENGHHPSGWGEDPGRCMYRALRVLPVLDYTIRHVVERREREERGDPMPVLEREGDAFAGQHSPPWWWCAVLADVAHQDLERWSTEAKRRMKQGEAAAAS